MNCSQAKKWISPYLDSELDASVTFDVSQHLERCRACRERFEREARTEELIAGKLRRHEPSADWGRIQRAVLAPRRTRLWGSAGLIAAAACIVLAVAAIAGWPRVTHAHPAQWAVDELNRLSPSCQPFTHPSCQAAQIDQMASEVLHCAFPLQLDASQLAGVVKRVCPGGTPRLEVHMNCCGKPVLLTVARRNCLGELNRVGRAVEASHHPSWKDRTVCNGVEYEVAASRCGELYVIAVSPCPHALDHLLAIKQ